MNSDPRDVIAQSPMSRLQIIVVGLTIALNALDGFDVLSISFASPGIAAEWGIDRAALGIVLSMELIGMAIGSMVLGGVADKIGRRPTILGCLVVMSGGMLMATTVTGLVDLSIWRVITGLGIGGMLAAINAVSAEFASTKRRHLSVSLMSIGYPVGAVLGGLVAARLLQGNDWRSVFYFGAGVTAALIPITYFVMPESVHWLARKQPAGALEKINHAMTRMGHPAMTALPVIAVDARKKAVSDIFGPGLVAITAIVTLAYFFHITTFYFILKWVPKIVADFGFAASSAAGVLVWTNVGGALGGTVLGFHDPAVRGQGSDDCRDGAVVGDGGAVRPDTTRPATAVDDLRRGWLLHQRRNRRHVHDHRAGLSHARARHGHRLRDWRRARRLSARADHRRLPVYRRLFPAHRRADDGHRVTRGRRHSEFPEAGNRSDRLRTSGASGPSDRDTGDWAILSHEGHEEYQPRRTRWLTQMLRDRRALRGQALGSSWLIAVVFVATVRHARHIHTDLQRMLPTAEDHAPDRADVAVVEAARSVTWPVDGSRLLVGSISIQPMPGQWNVSHACEASAPTRRGIPGGGAVSR